MTQKLPTLVAVAATLALAACSSEPTGPRPSDAGLALAAGDNTVVVTEEDIARQPENTPPTRSWVLYSRLAGNGAFRSGPGTPPLGAGSFDLVTPTGADKATL